ncbi:MAG: hypothetical protein IBX40_01210 [Methanosarcinales archaeon]|nr:hypothetical protein [Methanosarcinales archaeon]
MKIRLEITMDNGINKDLQIQGIPTPEAILDLVNQLMSLQTTSSPVSSYQAAAVQNQWPNPQQPISQQPITQESKIRQMVPPQTSNYSSQPTIHKPTKQRGTRGLQLAEDEYSRLKNESLTIKERLELFLIFEYKDQWFTSLEVKRDYDRVYSNINLSTVSTYLSRMYREGKLERMGNRNRRQYCLKTEEQHQQFSPEPVWDQGMQTY